MSRYAVLEPALAIACTRELVARALRELGAPIELADGADGRLSLEGCIESAADPVEIKVAAGWCGALAEFGFVTSEQGLTLICKDVDRAGLERDLLPDLGARLRAQTALAALVGSGLHAQLEVDDDGVYRIVVRDP